MKFKMSERMALISAMLIFGTIGLVRKYIPFPSSVIALVRGAIGATFLILLQVLRRNPIDKNAIQKNAVKLILSGILIGANWICLFEAYRYTSVSVATICYYMAPVIVILASPFLFKEAITKKKGICSAVAVIGMILVSGVLETGLSGIKGILFGLSAAFMYATVVLLNKSISQMTSYDRTMVQLAVAAISLLPYVLLTENISTLKPTISIVVLLLLAGILHTGIAYALYFGSIKNLPAQTTALLSYIDPVLAVLLSFFVLKEEMSIISGVGVILVIGSMLISELSFAK